MDKDQILLLNKAVRAFRDIGSPYVGGVPCLCLANLLVAMEREIKALQKERDAAVEELKIYKFCTACIHDKDNLDANESSPCFGCSSKSNWQWRGVQEVEN